MVDFNITDSLSEADISFLQSVINEVQVSCVLPSQIPISSVVSYIRQAAMWMWEIDNDSLEERSYVI